MRILYVEDNLDDVALTMRQLEAQPELFEVEVSRLLEDALTRIRSMHDKEYDLILTDLNLADGSGLKLLSEVRRKGLPVSVVLITGQGDEQTAIAALKAGADDYIQKKPDYFMRLPQLLVAALKHFKEQKTRKTFPIRLLYAEHNPSDIELTLRHMEIFAPHIQVEVVRTSEEVLDRLLNNPQFDPVDLLLLDLTMQDKNAIDLIREIRTRYTENIPVILITGQGSEKTAIQALQLGVADYLVKQPGYLYRLPSVLENAFYLNRLEKEREALYESEERYRRLAENARDLIFRLMVAPNYAFDYVSPALSAIAGVSPGELYKDFDLLFKILNIPQSQMAWVINLFRSSTTDDITFSVTDHRGNLHWLEMRSNLIFDDSSNRVYIEGICRDITERKNAEEKIHKDMMKLNGLHLIDTAISSSFDLRLTFHLFIDQAVTLLEADGAEIILFEPDMSTPKIFISTGMTQLDAGQAGMVKNFILPDKSILDRKVVHLGVDQIKYQAPGLYDLMINEGFVDYWASALVAKGQIKGMLEIFLRERKEHDSDWVSFLEMLSQQASIAYENSKIFEKLQRTNQDLLRAYDDTLMGWVNFLDLRDHETEGHTLRVLELSIQIAELFGIQDQDLANMRRGVLLHDIGKIGVPDTILNKPGSLTDDEWEIMRRHPQFAYDMLSSIEYLRPALDIPYCHHERWDGTGYPRGLAGRDIPLAARIFSVIDAFDALVTTRPYHESISVKEALDILSGEAGKQYDPEVVEKCIPFLEKNQPPS